ncbi:hypothetical protein BIW11_00863 [Tropilaelaps mercedesae]|uniref:Uncharacterized protein n=1 Tax=Tropilaelaps mercedesae TaxID=418985 RepID=A0A1V9XNA0_9ACAR|nr:hypothetical protein BIW11_00863 [Tropilaelaps mercedesae]
MNPKRKDSTCDRRSPDVYSTSSAASSTKNTNSASQHHHVAQSGATRGARPRLNLQDSLREMNSVMRALDHAQLDSQGRLDELNGVLEGSPNNSVEPAEEALETLLRNQQSLLRQLADSRSQLSALEYQYQVAGNIQPSGCGLRVPSSKVGRGASQEVNAAVRVSQGANALVEHLRAQVQETAEEYRRAQGALEGVRLGQRTAATAGLPIDAYGEPEVEEVFERADPEGDAPVSDDNKIGNMQSSNARFARRLMPHGAPMSAPYTSTVTSFEFPETPEQSDIEDKIRKLNETKQQIDALRGIISKLKGGHGCPIPSRATPRPVPIYGTPPTPAPPIQPASNTAQQRRRQQLQDITRSLQKIETLIQREVTQTQSQLDVAPVGKSASVPGPSLQVPSDDLLSPLGQSHQRRNLSVSCDPNHSNPQRTGVRPRFNSCNNVAPPPEHTLQTPQQLAWGDAYSYPYGQPLLDVPPAYVQRGSQPRSLTEVATWGGSSTQDNSDNGEVGSDDCTDSEMERLAGAVGVDPLTELDPTMASLVAGMVRSARPKVREEPAGGVGPTGGVGTCEHCSHLATYTQMLTLSLVQANEVINGQQREIERLRGALMRPPASEAAAHISGVCPLNNQVTPGLRANNYVDNLKSLSTLNLLNQTAGVGLSGAPMATPLERRAAPAAATGERNDLGRDDERRRRPNKNSMNNQVNFCSSSSNNNSRYSSNPELNHRDGDLLATSGAISGASCAVNGGKVSLAQLSRERLEMQPALDAATAFLSTRAGELCTPDVLIQTCRCLLDQLTPAGVSHKHILRVLQPTLGQFLARPVEPNQIMETLTGVLQRELVQLAKSGTATPPERAFGAGVSGISDRSTAGNEQTEDAEGASGGDVEGGEEMTEADRGADDVPPEALPSPLAVATESDREHPVGSTASGNSCPSLDHVPTRETAEPTQAGCAASSATISPAGPSPSDAIIVSNSSSIVPTGPDDAK